MQKGTKATVKSGVNFDEKYTPGIWFLQISVEQLSLVCIKKKTIKTIGIMWVLLQCTEVPVVTGRVSVRDLAIYKHFFVTTGFFKAKKLLPR